MRHIIGEYEYYCMAQILLSPVKHVYFMALLLPSFGLCNNGFSCLQSIVCRVLQIHSYVFDGSINEKVFPQAN